MAEMTRIPAAPYTAPEPQTEHEMRNIGLGRNPDSPLAYVAELEIEGIIGSFRAHCSARSLDDARRIFESAAFFGTDPEVHRRSFAIKNIRIL